MPNTPVVDLGRRCVDVDHPLLSAPLSFTWLRHSCTCPACRHPNGQRLVDVATIDRGVHPTSAAFDGSSLVVVWSGDGHTSTYSVADLVGVQHSTREVPMHWDARIAPHLPRARHDQLDTSPSELLRWLDAVDRLGVGVLHGVPCVDGEVARVAERFGYVRHTNYGRVFDVRAVVDPTNLAYTSLGLPPHTDNPYRDPVPTLQLLHCMQSTASGGDNILVDAWRVADEVRSTQPDGFGLLATVPVGFDYADDSSELRTAVPILHLDHTGAVAAVRFNSRSMQPPRLPAEQLECWYEAFSLFCRLVADPAFQVQLHLEPGDLFIVDNRRVLHGRTAYDPAAGARHLQGCYSDIDGLRSTAAVLRRTVHSADGVVDRLFHLFATRGDAAYLGEPVSQTEHAVQTAAVAEQHGAAPAVVAAALLHDIGHLAHSMADDAADHGIDTVHQEVGARLLARWFPPAVTEPVRLHVAAKRHLCATDPAYLGRLSAASVHSLGLQGGPFSAAQAEAFAAMPFALDAVELRRYDDQGKDPTMALPSLEHFRPLLRHLVRP